MIPFLHYGGPWGEQKVWGGDSPLFLSSFGDSNLPDLVPSPEWTLCSWFPPCLHQYQP